MVYRIPSAPKPSVPMTRVPSGRVGKRVTGRANALTRGKGKKKGLRKSRVRIGTAVTVTKTPSGLKVRERK